MAEVSKHARQKLEESLRLLEHRKLYLAHWLETIVSTDSPNKETEHILNCLKTNKVLIAVRALPLIQMNFDLSAEVSNGIKMIDSFGSLFSTKVTEKNVNFSFIKKEIIECTLETPNSSISNAKKSSEWFSCSGKKSSERESCSVREEDSREWDSGSKDVCDARSKKAEKSCDWDICSEDVEKYRKKDICSGKTEKYSERDSCIKTVKTSSKCTSGSDEGKEIYREWNSSCEATNKSYINFVRTEDFRVQDSEFKEAGNSHERDSYSKENEKFCDWNCSKYAENSHGTDICSEKADIKAEIAREWNSSSKKWGQSCKWDSGFEEGKISSERNSESKKSKKLYREWNSSCVATNTSCVRDSSSQKREPREWGTGSVNVETSHQWDSRSKKAGKSNERDSLAHNVEKSDYWVLRSEKREQSCKWDSRPQKAEESREWDICSKTADISCESDSSLTQNTMKSRKWDICSAKEEKLNELESCFQTTTRTCEWDQSSKKSGNSTNGAQTIKSWKMQ